MSQFHQFFFGGGRGGLHDLVIEAQFLSKFGTLRRGTYLRCVRYRGARGAHAPPIFLELFYREMGRQTI